MEGSGAMPPNESRAHVLIATVAAFFVLDVFFVALRFWSRRIQRTKFRRDDFFVIAALLVITGTCITSIYSVKRGGVGRHLQHVPKQQRIQWLKSVFITAPSLYITSASLPKLAVICIYLNIFMDRGSRLCCWTIAIILAIGPLVTVFVIAFQCTPTKYLWDKTIPGGHCFNQALMFRYGSLPNIATDVVMLVLPMPLIWNLCASVKTKIGLLITFLLGSIGLITSILRFVVFFTPTTDGTWAAVPLLCWVIIEPSIYLWAACLLALKPLLKHIVQETSLSRLILRSRSGAKSTCHQPYTQGPSRGATKLPSNDGNSDKKILREREFCIERSFDSNEAFGMCSVSTSREQ